MIRWRVALGSCLIGLALGGAALLGLAALFMAEGMGVG